MEPFYKAFYYAHPIGKLIIVGLFWMLWLGYMLPEPYIRIGFNGDIVYHLPTDPAEYQAYQVYIRW
jgi:hypothetical protein